MTSVKKGNMCSSVSGKSLRSSNDNLEYFQKHGKSESLDCPSSSSYIGHCVNCHKPFLDDDGSVIQQSNTKLFVFKTTPGCFKEVSIISVVEAITYIFGDRFNPKRIARRIAGSGQDSNFVDDLELPLCTRCGDLVQCIYNLHKEFQEMCHADSNFQTLFKKSSTTRTAAADNSDEYYTNNSDDVVDMIVPTVVYGDDEKGQDGEGADDESGVLANNPCEDDSEEYEDEPIASRQRKRRMKRRRKRLTEPPKKKTRIEVPKLPPKKEKPKATLKSILQKLRQIRLQRKIAIELGVEKLEWKRRRLENSLHLFRIKQGRRRRANAGQDSIEKFSRHRQMRPKMRANDIIPTIQCSDCGYTCNKRFFAAHQNVMHRKVPAFVCNFCGRVNRDFENLKLHLSTHSWKRRPVLVKERRSSHCGQCPRIVRKSIFDLHIALHGIPRRFNCKKCNFNGENSQDLKDHQIVHEEGGYYAFKCDSCAQGFKIESFLIQHHMICEMRAVDRPFRCTICGFKRFKLKHHLESHLFEVHRLSKEESRAMVYPGLAKRTVNRKKK